MSDDPRSDVVEVRQQVVGDPGGDGARGRGRAENDTRDPSEATDDRVLHEQDRTKDIERAELHVRLAEGQQDAAECRDACTDRKGVELDADHADAERGGGAFVAPDRDHATAGCADPEVRHDEGDCQQGEKHQRCVPLRVRERIELIAEDLRTPDADPFEPACQRRVLEDDRAEHERERQCHDCQRDAPRADRRKCHEDADRGRGDDAHNDGEQEGAVEAVGCSRRGPRAEASERVLAQRQLARIPGHDDDRGDDDADPERHDERVGVARYADDHHDCRGDAQR